MLEIIAFVGGILVGLLGSVFFVAGFKAKTNIEATGGVFGKPKPLDPFLNTSREARIEQRRAEILDGDGAGNDIDLDVYQNE